MTNFSIQYFSKELDNLTFNDIEKYFAIAQEESDKMEFKAFHPKFGNFERNLEGVIRGICTFLNSNGGILIWGAPDRSDISSTIAQKCFLCPQRTSTKQIEFYTEKQNLACSDLRLTVTDEIFGTF